MIAVWMLAGAVVYAALAKFIRYIVTPKLTLGEVQSYVANHANVGVDKASSVLKLVREKPWIFYTMKLYITKD